MCGNIQRPVVKIVKIHKLKCFGDVTGLTKLSHTILTVLKTYQHGLGDQLATCHDLE